jgi:hypothetical protein
MVSKPDLAKLGSVVGEFSTLEVEDYQRVYVWSEDDIDLLFDDLFQCAGNEAIATHFFGTLILQLEDNDVAKVVDGQQRLSTAFLIVAALRDHLNPADSSLPKVGTKRQKNVYEKAQEFLTFDGDDDQFRLIPNRLLRDIMFKCVYPAAKTQKPVPWAKEQTADKPTDLNKPFRAAIRHIRKKIDEDMRDYVTYPEKLVRINDLLDALLSKFRVLVVPTDSIDESLDVFLTLNSRGAALQASDLARGEILKGLGSDQKDDKKLKIHEENIKEWNEISKRVGDTEVFLRHYMVASENISVTKKTMLKSVVTKLTPARSSADTNHGLAKDFWDALKTGSTFYNQIIEPAMGGLTQAYFEVLNLLAMNHRVLFLNVLPNMSSGKDLEETARLSYVLSYRWRLNGLNQQALEDFYREIGFSFAETGDVDALQKSLKNKAAGLAPISEKRWMRDQDSGAYTRALLYLLYFKLQGGAKKYSLNEFHLEHIAPQSRTEYWVKAMLNLDSIKDVEDDEWADVVSAGGNLMLLDPGSNLKIKNIPFRLTQAERDLIPVGKPTDKVSEYGLSVISLNQEIAEFDYWDMDLLKDRTKWLAEMFEILWSVEQPSQAVRTYTDWRDGS